MTTPIGTRTRDVHYPQVDKYGGLQASIHPMIQVYSASGAVTIEDQTAVITKGSAAALTLAAPAPTVHDGVTITFVSTGAFAHTITAPSNAIDGTHHLVTFGASAGNSVTLVAYQGVWYPTALITAVIS
jgi:plastocyanin